MKIRTIHAKRLLALVAGLGFAAWGTSVAKANLLSNGNMDVTSVGPQALATPTGWNVISALPSTPGFNDGASSEPWNNVADPSGFGVFFKTFFGDGANNLTVHLFQDNPATPGLTYTLTGWAGAGPGYSGFVSGGPTTTEFALQFLDAGSSIIGGTVLNLVPAGLGTGTTPGLGFGYKEFSVFGTAPAGTVSVRSRLSIINAYDVPGAGDAAFVGDNFILAVPEPTTAALVGLGLTALVGMRRRKLS